MAIYLKVFTDNILQATRGKPCILIKFYVTFTCNCMSLLFTAFLFLAIYIFHITKYDCDVLVFMLYISLRTDPYQIQTLNVVFRFNFGFY